MITKELDDRLHRIELEVGMLREEIDLHKIEMASPVFKNGWRSACCGCPTTGKLVWVKAAVLPFRIGIGKYQSHHWFVTDCDGIIYNDFEAYSLHPVEVESWRYIDDLP